MYERYIYFIYDVADRTILRTDIIVSTASLGEESKGNDKKITILEYRQGKKQKQKNNKIPLNLMKSR